MENLLSVQEAQEKILAVLNLCPVTTVPLTNASGCILAQDIISDIDLPPFSNSSVDGFAVIASDVSAASTERPVTLRNIADIPAGTVPSLSISNGQSVRIMTGAPLPGGADAVIPVEDTNHPRNDPMEQTLNRVWIFKAVKPGDNIRPQGQDLQKGQHVLSKGKKLTPQDCGMLASLGVAEVPVYSRPKVALLSSGDELVSPADPLTPGKIRDINTTLLAALIEQFGAEVIHLGVAPDNQDVLRHRFNQAVSSKADLILTSAGVSVGAFDYVRNVIEEQGQLSFWKVNMRPGKPLAFGTYRSLPIIGLPGNPVSAYVGFLVFVLPALNKMTGISETRRRSIRAVLDHDVESDGRESYLRVILRFEENHIIASLNGHQGSGNLFSLVHANALLIVPAGIYHLPAGSDAEVWLLDDQWH